MASDITSINEQAVAAVKVLLYVGPVAVYVLWLGLVNSQATPKLVRARDDFLIMTMGFCPFAAAPVLGLVRAGYGWASVAAAGLMLFLFLRLLPPKDSGWVIYNISPPRARRLAERALRSLGWAHRWDGRTAIVAEKKLAIEMSSLLPLRNVTFHLRPTKAGPRSGDIDLLGNELACRVDAQTGLPSTTGCCLLIGGVGLLILPLWMLSHHSAVIAEVMTRILLS